MILLNTRLQYFKALESNVSQGMANGRVKTPYFIEGDRIVEGYECIRDVWWKRKTITEACATRGMSRSVYYELEGKLMRNIQGAVTKLNKLKIKGPRGKLMQFSMDWS